MGKTAFVLLMLNCLVCVMSQEHGNSTYSPEELLLKKIKFNGTVTARQNYGSIKFEDNFDQTNEENKPFAFEDTGSNNPPTAPNTAFKFEDYPIIKNVEDSYDIKEANNQAFDSQDDNNIEEPKPQKKKRRRRRRKPKYQNGRNPVSPHQFQGYPSQIPNGYQGYPGNLPQGYPGQDPQGYPGQYPGNPQNYPGQYLGNPQGQQPGQFYRPPRRPRQSLASSALSAVTGALTSIAQYDDYQCVPRLLCEAGGGALGSSSILQNIAGLQPLLTLLAAYNGISSSPLFVFGRAVFLGMTAKGNLGTCRYAYPQCPTDPEQLVHYLNNHNGGFFRFFNAPQLNNPQGQQNVEQFYNQLSQNYGIYQPNPQNFGVDQQNYGIFPQNQPNYGINQQNYGIYQPNAPNQPTYQPNLPPLFHYQNLQANPQVYGFNNPNSYGLPQNYGSTYPYQNNFGHYKSNDKEKKNHKIETRILNKPYDGKDSLENTENSKWLFPESSVNNDNIRGGRDLKFPDDSNQYSRPFIRDGKGFSFPNYQNNIKYTNYYTETSTASYNQYGFYQNTPKYQSESTTQNVAFQNIYNPKVNYHKTYANNQNNNNLYNNGEELETVYIIRGNGDPNHPEIVKLRPGEKLQ